MVKHCILLLLVFLLLVSCRKDLLTYKARVEFKFGLSSFELKGRAGTPNIGNINEKSTHIWQPGGGRSYGKDLYLHLDSGTLAIEQVFFKGRRKPGSDFNITYTPEKRIIADLSTGKTNKPIILEVPMGVYTRVELGMQLETQVKTPVVIQGKLNKHPSNCLPVRFEYSFSDKIRVWRSEEYNPKVFLSGFKQSVIWVELNLPFLFGGVDIEVLKLASSVTEADQEIILINESNNTQIYNMISRCLPYCFILAID